MLSVLGKVLGLRSDPDRLIPDLVLLGIVCVPAHTHACVGDYRTRVFLRSFKPNRIQELLIKSPAQALRPWHKNTHRRKRNGL